MTDDDAHEGRPSSDRPRGCELCEALAELAPANSPRSRGDALQPGVPRAALLWQMFLGPLDHEDMRQMLRDSRTRDLVVGPAKAKHRLRAEPEAVRRGLLNQYQCSRCAPWWLGAGYSAQEVGFISPLEVDRHVFAVLLSL